MELCLIAPIDMLEYTELWPRHMCIGPVAVESDVYREFYTEQVKQGRTVILDNGTFEGNAISNEWLYELAETIRPSIIVLPDKINCDMDEARQIASTAAERIHAKYPDMKTMFVIQAQDWSTFAAQWFWAQRHSKIDYIGICRDALWQSVGSQTYTPDQDINRLVFNATLQETRYKKTGSSKPVHFLGFGHRCEFLQFYHQIESCDTTTPIVQAMAGNRAPNFDPDLRRPAEYFHIKYQSQFDELLQYNCDYMRKFAENQVRLSDYVGRGTARL